MIDEEIERLDWLFDRPAHLAAWWAEEGDQPVALTMGWGEYRYLVGETVWAFAPRDGRHAEILPQLGGTTSVSCQLNFAIGDPNQPYDRLAALNLTGAPDWPLARVTMKGLLGFDGDVPSITWYHEDASVWFALIPDSESPRGIIRVIKPYVSAPSRLWPPLP